ncbi:MAG: outer membrane protein assembly factor BamD [Steroidobacteraceae bacterium]
MRLLPNKSLAVFALAIVLGLTAVSGCRGGPDSRLARLSSEALYQRAHQALTNRDYEEAIRTYEALTSRFPFTEQARQARLDIIYAYYRQGEKESALDAVEQFIRENPAHPRVDYAWYLRGLIDFERTPFVVERWLRVDFEARPPTTARKSFTAFKTVVEQFPKSIYAHDAQRRMVYLRNRLAEYEIRVARYYTKRGAWVAAARRAEQSIEQYDGAPSMRDALKIMIQAYQKLGYTELAANTERVYKENFPGDPANATDTKHPWWQLWRRG